MKIKPGYRAFIEENFRIVNKEGRAVPFVFNPIQNQFFDDATGRDIVLKARQQGFSSLILALFTVDFLMKENSNSVVIADTSENAQALLERVKIFIKWYEDKNHVKVPLKYNSKRELVNAAMNSKYTIGTANNSEFGRSRTISNLHFSEAAFYPNFQKLMASATQAVVPDGRVVIETTANGFNEFKTFWDSAKLGEGNFNPLFYPASKFYGPDFLDGKRAELKRQFVQEYPESPEEAFINSGDCYFDTESLKRLLRTSEIRGIYKDQKIYV